MHQTIATKDLPPILLDPYRNQSPIPDGFRAGDRAIAGPIPILGVLEDEKRPLEQAIEISNLAQQVGGISDLAVGKPSAKAKGH